MGLLSNLFKTTLGGGSGIDGAYNAHIAELVIKELKPDEKRIIANEVIEMGVRSSRGRVNAEQFCDQFNRHNRLCQLNLIALALAKFNIHILPNGKWMPIKNPFTLQISQEDILTNALYLLKKDSLIVKIEPGQIDIKEWSSPPPPRKNPINENAELVGKIIAGIEISVKSSKLANNEKFIFTLLHFGICYLTHVYSKFDESFAEELKDLGLRLVLTINKEKIVPISLCIVYEKELSYVANALDLDRVEHVHMLDINYGELMCISHSFRANELWNHLPDALGNSTNMGNPHLTSLLCKYVYNNESTNFIEIQLAYFQVIDKILSIMKEENWI